MDVKRTYPSLLGGVSQQTEDIRGQDTMWEQINVFPDPIRGLTRRWPQQYLDSIPLAPDLVPVEFRKQFAYSAAGREYLLSYRYQVKGPYFGGSVFAADLTGEVMLPVIANGADVGLLDTGGVSAVTALGRFVLLAGNTMTPTFTATEQWTPEENQKRHVVWVRGGAYSRVFQLSLIRGNQKFTVSYTTRSASYPLALDTSDILPTDPEYSKKVNDRTNAYNTQVTRWAGEALADAAPSNIAERLAIELRVSGFLSPGSTVEVLGSTVCITDPSVEEVEADDGGDGSLIRAVGNGVGAPELLSTIAWPGKVVRVRPTNDAGGQVFYLKAVAKDRSTGAFTEVSWEECPGVLYQITRAFAVGVAHAGNFYVSTDLAWLEAQIGEPVPRFIASVTGDAASTPPPKFLSRRITALGVFQDRLLVGAGNTIIASRPGDYFNFFRGSLLTLTAGDPAEFQVIGGEDDTMRGMLIYDRSLIINGDRRQYVIDGRTAFSAVTPSATVFSNIPGTGDVTPITAGNFMFFAKGDAGSTSVHQVQPGQIEQSPVVVELTENVWDYVEGRPTLLAGNNTPDAVFVCTDSIEQAREIYQGGTVYCFFYRDIPGQGRVMANWGKWRVGGVNIAVYPRDGYLYLMQELSASDQTETRVSLTKIKISGELSELPYLDYLWDSLGGPNGSAFTNVLGVPAASAGIGNGPLAWGYDGQLNSSSGRFRGYVNPTILVPTSPIMRSQTDNLLIHGDTTVMTMDAVLNDTSGVQYSFSLNRQGDDASAYGETYVGLPDAGSPVWSQPTYPDPGDIPLPSPGWPGPWSSTEDSE